MWIIGALLTSNLDSPFSIVSESVNIPAVNQLMKCRMDNVSRILINEMQFTTIHWSNRQRESADVGG